MGLCLSDFEDAGDGIDDFEGVVDCGAHSVVLKTLKDVVGDFRVVGQGKRHLCRDASQGAP